MLHIHTKGYQQMEINYLCEIVYHYTITIQYTDV